MKNLKNGWMKKFVNYFVFSFLFFSLKGWSFVPPVANVVRHQPSVISNQRKAFETKGRMIIGEQTLSYNLTWYGRDDYLVKVAGVSSGFYNSPQPSGTQQWTMQRKGSQCLLSTGSLRIACPEARTWGKVELSGSATEATQALKEAGIIGTGETQPVYVTKDDYMSHSPTRPQLTVGKNGPHPVAVLKIASRSINAATTRELEIQYDQGFFAPLYLHTVEGGKPFTILAESDLEIRKGRDRFTPVIANKLQVYHMENLIAVLVREEPEWKSGMKSSSFSNNASVSLATLSAQLSPVGQMLLHAILVTH